LPTTPWRSPISRMPTWSKRALQRREIRGPGSSGGGFLAALAWWLVELASAIVASEPTLGPLELVLVKHHGAPVEIEPISAWSTRSSRSQAGEALQALKTAIASSPRRSSARLPILQHDTWDLDRGHLT